jgi:hypothetical protein
VESQSFSASLSHDFSLSGEVTSIFKGFKKRDPVTKIKALQTFRGSYLAREEAGNPGLEAVVGTWSYYYQRLIIDNSKQVRLEASQAHQEVLKKVGKKGLQTYLPRFLAQWLRSQFDESPEVAQIATRSLATVLQGPVLHKALKHYLGSVLDKLCKDLCAQESVFGDSTIESKEDIRDRHARVLFTSLRCIVYVIETLKENANGDWALSEEERDVLVCMSKECNFGKSMMGSRSPFVRQAAYYYVGRIALHCKEVISACEAEMRAYIIGSFKEKDSVSYKSIFEMVIVINKGLPGIWEGVDMNKTFWPKFHQFLRCGCHNSARFSYLALLPFLSTLPATAWKKSLLEIGLGNNSNENNSKRRWDIILKTMECLLSGIKVSLMDVDIAQLGGQCAAECFLFFSFKFINQTAAEFYLQQQQDPGFGSEEDMRMDFIKAFLEGVYYPFLFERGEGEYSHSRLLHTGHVIFNEVLKVLSMGDGTHKQRKDALGYLLCNLKQYILTEFSSSEQGGGAKEKHVVDFLSNLNPCVEVANFVISPLVHHLVTRALVSDFSEDKIKYLLTLIERYGEHLAQNSGGGDIDERLTGLCMQVSSSQSSSPAFYRLVFSWLNHSDSLRSQWPTLISQLSASGNEALRLRGAELLTHAQAVQGISCKGLDGLVNGFAAEDFVEANTTLALGVFQSVLLLTSERYMLVNEEVVTRILKSLQLAMLSCVKGCRERRPDDILAVMQKAMIKAGKAFPKHLLSDLTETVTFAICLQWTYTFEGRGSNIRDLWQDGAFVKHFGLSPGTDQHLAVGNCFVSTVQTFVTDWCSKSKSDEIHQPKLFGKEICKLVDTFDESAVLSFLSKLIEPQNNTWPLWVDPETNLVSRGRSKAAAAAADGDLADDDGYKRYARFILSVMTNTKSYDSIYKLSCSRVWVPVELISACIPGHVDQASVYEYICILHEKSQNRKEEEEEGDILHDIFIACKDSLSESLLGQDVLHTSMLKENPVIGSISLLLHWFEVLCPTRLLAIFEQVVLAGSMLDATSQPQHCGQKANYERLVLLYKIEKCLLGSINQVISGADLLEDSNSKIPQSLETAAKALTSSAHLSMEGTSLDDLVDKRTYASVLAAEIISEFFYTVGKKGGVAIAGERDKGTQQLTLNNHLWDISKAMVVMLGPGQHESITSESESNRADTKFYTACALLYGTVKVQSQMLYVDMKMKSELSFSFGIALRNLGVTLTRLAALFEDLVEVDETEEDFDNVNVLLNQEFDVVTDSAESALSLFVLLLGSHSHTKEMVKCIGVEGKDALLKCCLRVVFCLAALHVRGIHQSKLASLSADREFCQALLEVTKHASKPCLLEALEEANSWLAAYSNSNEEDALHVLVNVYTTLNIQCNIRACVGFLLSTRTYLALLSCPKKEEGNFYFGDSGDDVAAYAVTSLGMPPVFVEIIFKGGTAISVEVRIRAWALFLSYLKTLGNDSLKFMCSLLRSTEAVNNLLTLLVAYLPKPDKSMKKGGGGNSSRVEENKNEDEDEKRALIGLRDIVTNANLFDEAEYIVRGSASVYHSFLHLMPSSICSWFMEIRDRQLISSIESYTSVNETPQLIERELQSISSRGDLEVTPLQSKREVVTRYRKDDSTLELVIKLPTSFPLKPVEVEYIQKFGFGEAVLRKWLLSIRSFLRNQDGTIDDAIYLWYQNVEKQFQGVEDCPICYSIIHTTDHTLPRLKCRTCGKKFHSSCMYKWFSTNHKSTCPMCRALW